MKNPLCVLALSLVFGPRAAVAATFDVTGTFNDGATLSGVLTQFPGRSGALNWDLTTSIDSSTGQGFEYSSFINNSTDQSSVVGNFAAGPLAAYDSEVFSGQSAQGQVTLNLMFNTQLGVFNFDSFVPGNSVTLSSGQTVPINFETLTVNGTTTTRYLLSEQIVPAPVPLPPSVWLMLCSLAGMTPLVRSSRCRHIGHLGAT